MKKKLFMLALIGAMVTNLVACSGDIKADNTMNETQTETATETEIKAEPETVEVASIAPLNEILSGIEDIKVQENTDVNLNELVFVDESIVKNVDIDDSAVDYTKTGVYDVIYTITFDADAFKKYIEENDIKVGFDIDTDGDTIVVTTKVTVEIVTEEVAAEIIENNKNLADDEKEIIITNKTIEDMKSDSKAQVTKNVAESKPTETANKTVDNSNKTATNNSKSTDNSNKTTTNNSNKTVTNSNKSTNNSNKNTANNSNKTATNTKTESKSETKTETKPAHTHSYTSKVTKKATCTSKGIITHTCACGNSYTTTISKTAHDYVHHDATGHKEQVLVKEAYDEDVYEGHVICNGCGKDFGMGTTAADNWGIHAATDFSDNCESYHVENVKTGTVHHNAVYETKWVEDSPAYDKCKNCGHIK